VLVTTALVELVYSDASGSTGALTLHTSAAHTVSEIASEALALGAIVASVSSCVLVRLRIKYTVWEDTVTPAAIGSSVKRRAVLYLTTSDTTPLALVEILSPIDGVFKAVGPTAGYEIDPTNTDVIAFVEELIAENATNVFGDAITAYDAGYLQSRV
jgi:hypothetical protein